MSIVAAVAQISISFSLVWHHLVNVDLEAAFFTISWALNWCIVPGSKTCLKDKILKWHVAVQPPHHQSELCVIPSTMVSFLRGTVRHRCRKDVSVCSMWWCFCFSQFSVFQLCPICFYFSIILHLNTDWLRYLGCMLCTWAWLITVSYILKIKHICVPWWTWLCWGNGILASPNTLLVFQ